MPTATKSSTPARTTPPAVASAKSNKATIAAATKAPVRSKAPTAAPTAPAKRTAAPAPAKPGSAPTRAKAAAAPTAPKAASRGRAKTPVLASITLKQMALAYSERKGLAKREAQELFAEIFDTVTSHIRNGTKVRIEGLGIFQVKDKPARTGRNPATGEAVKIAASRKLAFRPAKDMKEAL